MRMKQSKKVLAVILAALIALSAMAVGTAAFAAESGDSLVSKLMEDLWANKTNINTNRPTDAEKAKAYDEKLNLYHRIITAYQPLNDEERDSIPVQNTLRFLSAFIQREAYEIKAEYDASHDTAMTAVESQKAAQAGMTEQLGPHTAREEALALAGAHLFKPYKDNLKVNARMKFDCQEAIDAFIAYKTALFAASPMARAYLDGISPTFQAFSNNTVGGTVRDYLSMVNNYYLSQHPYVAPDGSTSAPKNPVTPKPAFGTPEYDGWLEGQRVNKQWTADEKEYSNQRVMTDLKELETLPDFKNMVPVMLDMNTAYRAFIEKGEEMACKTALQAYENLNSYEQAVISANNNGAYYYIFLQSSGKDYGYSNLSYSQMSKKCAEVGSMVLVREFAAWLDQQDVSKTDNALAEAARSEYQKVPASMRNNIPAETMEKYRAILAKSQYIDEIEREHEGEFESVTITMASTPLTNVADNTLLPNLNNLLTLALNGLAGQEDVRLTELLQSYFTNETVTMLAKGLPGVLAPLLGDQAGMFNLAPNRLAAQLTETQFAKAKTELEKYTVWEEVPGGLVLDWGVENGDYDSFMTAALASFRGLGSGTGWEFVLGGAFQRLFLNEFGYAPGGGKDAQLDDYSIYELALIPLFEALGAENVMTSAEYEAKVPTSYRIEDFLRPIVDQLYQEVLLKLAADPTGWLVKNLPNLIYHLDDGCILGGLEKATDMEISMVGNLQGLLKGFLGEDWSFKGLLNQFIDLSALGTSYEDITAISKMGKSEKITSKSFLAPESLRVTADEASVEAYLINALNSLIANAAGIDFSVSGQFVKQEAPAYPHNGKMDKKVMNAMIDGLDGLLSGFVNINELINNGFCTNVMAADAITGIYGALGGIDLSALGLGSQLVPPSAVADAMSEDKYKDVKAALQANSWNDVALVVKNGDKVYSCVDMGFKDGDRDGFINCLVAALRPLVGILCDSGLVTNRTVDGETVYGLYETLIIPVMEALGLTPATNSAEYTDNYNKLNKSDAGKAADYALKTILDPVLDLVNQVAAAPVATLMKLLPNLAYAIQYNPTLAFLGNLLDDMGGLTGILNGLVQGVATGEDADGNPVYGLKDFELPAIDLDTLASYGQVKEVASKSALHKTCATVVLDSADTFVTIFYYLYDAVNYKDNMKAINSLIAGIDGIDPSISAMIDSILNDVFTLSKEEALCALGSLLAAEVWECPAGADNSGEKTPSTGDYTIPAAVVLLMMVSAGGAILLLNKKKPAAIR